MEDIVLADRQLRSPQRLAGAVRQLYFSIQPRFGISRCQSVITETDGSGGAGCGTEADEVAAFNGWRLFLGRNPGLSNAIFTGLGNEKAPVPGLLLPVLQCRVGMTMKIFRICSSRRRQRSVPLVSVRH